MFIRLKYKLFENMFNIGHFSREPDAKHYRDMTFIHGKL